MSEKNIKIDDSVSVGEESLQNPQAETNQQSWENKYENKKEVEGILEISENGFGFLRFDNFLTGEDDVYVANSQIRRFNLKTGDKVKGIAREPRDGERFGGLLQVKEVNGDSPEKAKHRKNFDKLTPVYPDRRIVLENGRVTALRFIDLIAPVGFGQRGLIVAKPKAGKTVLLKNIAISMKRSLKNDNEVIYSTFDEEPSHHIKVAEMVLARSKRLAEQGKDVVILLDSITRLARAYNLSMPPSGKTLSGGLDPASLFNPKKFFGAARNLEEGGSITILATALVDTGSRMDDVIFEEFKGTGNMEIHLDRNLSERRIFPAIDINKSGTRREDLLMNQDELMAVWQIRKDISNSNSTEVTEKIIDGIERTKNNRELLMMTGKM